MRRKGISSIIASVMVLAVTVSVVALFAGWAPDLVLDLTEDTANQSKAQLNCNKADLDIISAKYYSSGETTAVVRNTGTVDLKNIRLEAWRNDLPLNDTETGLGPGNFTSKNITTSEEPTSVRTISQKCSNAQDRFEDIE